MSFFEELRRRNVIRVGIAYAVASWLLLQLTDVLIELLELSTVAGKYIVLLLIIGFVPALIFAWAFEMTPEGIKREKDVDRSQSIAPKTGRKLDYMIIGVLVVALGYFIYESRFATESTGVEAISTAQNVSAETSQSPAEAVLDPNSIAVLPFANRSSQDDDQFFTDGIHDDLLTQLAKISDLKVISRTSVMEYRDTTKKIPEIAAELGVTKILEGGIQRAGKRIRINAQLIDVATDQHLWAETFDREMTMENIFDIQSEITRQIVTAVKGELSAADQQTLEKTPTTNLQAYEAYLRARAATLRADYTKDKYIEAQPWAERATELDPEFAEAWALLAEIHGQAYWIGYDTSEQRQADAKTALDKAVALKPDSAIVIAARADHQYRFNNNYGQALALYKEAQALAPGDARIMLYTAITQRRSGHWEEGIHSFEEARQLDPANIFIVTQLVDTLSLMNEWERVNILASDWVIRYPESRDLRASQISAKMNRNGDLKLARELFDLLPAWSTNTYFRVASVLPLWERDYDAMLEILDSPALVGYTDFGGRTGRKELSRGIAHHFKGEKETARSYFDQVLKMQEPTESTTDFDRAFGLTFAAQAYMYMGDSGLALAASKRAVEIIPREKDSLFGSNIERNHTLILAMAGQRDEALERLAENIDGIGGYSRWELHLNPVWDFFRDDPRFVELATPPNLNEALQ
ncbi:MAG: TolB-like protein [Rhodothermales bacterium]|jgi:TolB-like protein